MKKITFGKKTKIFSKSGKLTNLRIKCVNWWNFLETFFPNKDLGFFFKKLKLLNSGEIVEVAIDSIQKSNFSVKRFFKHW